MSGPCGPHVLQGQCRGGPRLSLHMHWIYITTKAAWAQESLPSLLKGSAKKPVPSLPCRDTLFLSNWSENRSALFPGRRNCFSLARAFSIHSWKDNLEQKLSQDKQDWELHGELVANDNSSLWSWFVLSLIWWLMASSNALCDTAFDHIPLSTSVSIHLLLNVWVNGAVVFFSLLKVRSNVILWMIRFVSPWSVFYHGKQPNQETSCCGCRRSECGCLFCAWLHMPAGFPVFQVQSHKGLGGARLTKF